MQPLIRKLAVCLGVLQLSICLLAAEPSPLSFPNVDLSGEKTALLYSKYMGVNGGLVGTCALFGAITLGITCRQDLRTEDSHGSLTVPVGGWKVEKDGYSQSSSKVSIRSIPGEDKYAIRVTVSPKKGCYGFSHDFIGILQPGGPVYIYNRHQSKTAQARAKLVVRYENGAESNGSIFVTDDGLFGIDGFLRMGEEGLHNQKTSSCSWELEGWYKAAKIVNSKK